MNIKIIAIIQARMASSRLPGKVMLDIAGEPMLARVVERTSMATTLDRVVVATTTDPNDDPIQEFCTHRGIACFRGSQFDVLDRYYQAARAYAANVIVRITADCPLIDPDLIDHAVISFLGDKLPAEIDEAEALPWDFAANRLPPPWGRTYPIGLDVELCTYSALQRAWIEATQTYQREHVMPYLYEPDHSVHFSSLETPTPHEPIPANHFRVLQINHDPDYGHMRWTVDTAEDLHLVREIFTHFHAANDFKWLDVVRLFEEQPELARINANVTHKHAHDVDTRANKT
jgi:spore coat polysaccharide biosynthesis protein SpsF